MRKPVNPEYLSDVIGLIAPDPIKSEAEPSPSQPKAGASFREYHQRPAPKREQKRALAPKPDPALAPESTLQPATQSATQPPPQPSGVDRRRGSRTLRQS
jgi:hypothetical protein